MDSIATTQPPNRLAALHLDCVRGHRVKTSISNFLHARIRCKRCEALDKRGQQLARFQLIAKQRGGGCRSDCDAGQSQNLVFRCKEGHQWSAWASNIVRGVWCPQCAAAAQGHAYRLTIESLRETAASRRGHCLSKTYVNNATPVLWQCEKGHKWEATPASIRMGTWCPFCNSRRRTLELVRDKAEEFGGTCLARTFKNAATPLEFRCSHGHYFRLAPSFMFGNKARFCPRCGAARRGDARRLTIAEMSAIALQRGGRCLSTEYESNMKALQWECGNQHQWWAPAANVKNGSWCPHCHSSYGERIARAYLEAIFDKPFPYVSSVALPWLRTGPRHRLQLDGYCEKLKLAFEHQGEQHYRRVEYFHRDASAFTNQRARDRAKQRLCKRFGVKLLAIPAVGVDVPVESVKVEILTRLRALKVRVPGNAARVEIDWRRVYAVDHLSEYRILVESRGGRLLSDRWLGSIQKLKHECANGHNFWASPSKIRGGAWCRLCADRRLAEQRRGTIEQAREMAQQRGGQCLSDRYVSARAKLDWQCSHGHLWQATPDSIKRGSWCPSCAGKKRWATRRLT